MSSERITIRRFTEGEDETIALGAELGRVLRAGDVVALHGELGAGKTRFVRGVARGMGIDPDGVSSPTFVLMNEYDGAFLPLVHADAYRLRGADELESTGWDVAADGRAVVVVEWAERIESALPAVDDERRFDVRLWHDETGGESRRIEIEGDARRLSAVRGERVAGATGRRCPTCGGAMREESETFPFCSDRCRQADLGMWFSESYRISREIKDSDLEEGE